MSEFTLGLRSDFRMLAQGIDSLGARGAAAVLGVCGKALASWSGRSNKGVGEAGSFPTLAPRSTRWRRSPRARLKQE
jgi:hypothetical protein